MDGDSPMIASLIRCLDEGNSQCRRVHDDRIGPPANLSRLVAAHLPQAGITRIAEVTALDRIGIPVAIAIRPNSRTLSVNQGKGADLPSAVASATMEALELATAEQLPPSLRLASLGQLQAEAERVLDLGRSTRCHARKVGRTDQMLWTDGYDHCSRQTVAVPWSLVGADYRADPPGFHPAFQVSTDGLASGRTYCEAIFHGLCELIERDASALLDLTPTATFAARTRHVGPDDPPTVMEMDRQVRAAGCSLTVTDMTTDLGVPAFTAVISDRANAPKTRYGHSGGCGCHPDRARALVRAITEAAQSRLTRITGSRDDLPLRLYQPAADEDDDTYTEIVVGLDGQDRQHSGPPSLETSDSIPVNIRALVARLQASGLSQIVSVPLSNPFGIAVVRVIVPGLQTEIVDAKGSLGARALAVLMPDPQ